MVLSQSGKPTKSTREALDLLREAFRRIPRFDVEVAMASAGLEKSALLTSKQANIAVAILNGQLRRVGLPPITPKDLMGENTKPTYSGCLDPCKGTTASSLLALLMTKMASKPVPAAVSVV